MPSVCKTHALLLRQSVILPIEVQVHAASRGSSLPSAGNFLFIMYRLAYQRIIEWKGPRLCFCYYWFLFSLGDSLTARGPHFQGCLLYTCSLALSHRIRNSGGGITAFGWFWVRLPETESAVHVTTWLLFLGGGELYYIGRKLEKEVKWAAKGQNHLMRGCNVQNPRNGMINLLESVSLLEASGQVPSICNL